MIFSMTGFMRKRFVLRPVVVVVSVDMMVCDVVRKILLGKPLVTEEAFRLELLKEGYAEILQLTSPFVSQSPPGTVGFDSVHSPRILHNLLPFQLDGRLRDRLSLTMILVEAEHNTLFLHVSQE
jgi:hypothetical protein